MVVNWNVSGFGVAGKYRSEGSLNGRMTVNLDPNPN